MEINKKLYQGGKTLSKSNSLKALLNISVNAVETRSLIRGRTTGKPTLQVALMMRSSMFSGTVKHKVEYISEGCGCEVIDEKAVDGN